MSRKHISKSIMESADLSPLLLKASEACRLLGGVHPRTLARLEERGLLRSVKLLRHRLYPYDQITNLITNLQSYQQP